MSKSRLYAFPIFLCGLVLGYGMMFYEPIAGRFPFRLGLDLAGGTQLVYRADVSSIPESDVNSSMAALRDVIERRVNLFGVSEPIVQIEKSSFVAKNREERLIVELPGITDVAKATALLGKTPLLEFKLLRDDLKSMTEEERKKIPQNELFIPTGLTGAYLKSASLQFQSKGISEPIVALNFTKEGTDLFAKITREHKGEVLAIFLDGAPISTPVIRDEITSGTAVISGGFKAIEARELARNLSFGALPVPIELVATESVGASLGAHALNSGMHAGIIGFLLVVAFLIIWYRLPGLVASVALVLYVVLMLTTFKLIPVTLTAAGIAGFILTIGMAVDANILIFERIREEYAGGTKTREEAVREGFNRAWPSIRDSNISSMLTAVILFWIGTSLVKGFALTFGVGVIISMLTAISISRTFLFAVSSKKQSALMDFLYSSGLRKH